MSINVTFNGATYTIPAPGESSDWGSALNAFLVALGGALGSQGGTIAPATGKGLVITANAVHAPLILTPQASAPTGPNAVGDLYTTSAGVLKICTVAGSPGTFVSVGAQT